MKISITMAGIAAAVALPLIGQIGFSETCSQEILGVGVPWFLSLPGLITAYIGRLRGGDVTALGFKK